MKKPLVSIVIPAFNEQSYLPAAIIAIRKSVLFSRFPAEVIVVDNNSSDATREIAEKLADKVYTEKKHVIAAVRNAGARHANGKYLIFVDADTIVPASLVREFVHSLSKGAVVVSCAVMPHPLNYFEKTIFGFLNFILRSSVFHGPAFSGNAVGYNRNVFEKLRGFDEKRHASEDHDLSNRASKYGKAVFLKRLIVLTSNRRIKNFGLITVLLGWAKTTLFYLLGIKRKKYRIAR